MARTASFFKHRKRLITLLSLAICAFWIIPGLNEVGVLSFLLWFATFIMLFGSQFFWISRILDIAQRFLPREPRRMWLTISATVLYASFFFGYNSAPLKMIFTGHVIHASDPRTYRKIVDSVFAVWLVGSFLGFVLMAIFWTADRGVRSAAWAYRQIRTATGYGIAPESNVLTPHESGRRRLLQQIAIAVSATPFAAAVYGLVHERVDVEVIHRRIALARLPKAFEGFRIAQLSDFHIGSFMPADQIRRCVAITDKLKADLVVLTGDYLSWDPSVQEEVVLALADLRAPFGVFGCLGNHETLTRTETSITETFTSHNIRILRQEQAPIQLYGEVINLIGIDDSQQDLEGVERLMMPDTVNILLIHDTYPDSFERAAELGIDLTLAGHTHGGQLSLEFLHRGLCLARLETRYTSGWYEKSGHQLYVNRGIGTSVIPVRLGARPEITVLELVRAM